MLWECGCTVTVQARLCATEFDWAVSQNQASEKLKTLGDNTLSNTFLTFARLVKLLKIEKPSDGEAAKMRFNKAAYNPSIHKAAATVISLMSSSSSTQSRFEQSMMKLELAWGREVLSNQYSKLMRLSSLAKTSANDTRSPDDVASWMVDMLHLALNTKLITVNRATEQWLDRDRKHAKNGFWPACLQVLEAACRKCCAYQLFF